MPVIRVHKKSNYTVLSNEPLREKKMSLKAKGMLCVMLSLPDDWNYSISGLESICSEGSKAIRTTLKELEDFGYLYREKVHGEDGKISYTYHIYEIPHKKEIEEETELECSKDAEAEPETEEECAKKEGPCTHNPCVPEPYAPKGHTEKDTLLNTNLLSTNNKILNTNKAPTSKTEEDKSRSASVSDRELFDRFGPNLSDAVKDWIAYKKERREAYKPVGLRNLLAQIENKMNTYGKEAAISTIRLSISNGWRGIIWDKIEKSNISHGRQESGNPFLSLDLSNFGGNENGY